MRGPDHFHDLLIVFMTLCIMGSTISLGTGIVAAQQGESEPNNSQNEATSINTGSQVNARLGLGDEDWYSFRVDGPSTVRIDLEDLGGANIELIGPNGATLETEGPTPGDFSVDVDEGGTYYLRFTTVGSANGDYSFTISVEPAGNDSSESGGGKGIDDKYPGQCNDAPILEEGIHTGIIEVGDQDSFRIPLTKGQTVVYSVRVADGHSTFYLWDTPHYQDEPRTILRNVAGKVAGVENVGAGILVKSSTDGSSMSIELLAEESGPMCLVAQERDSDTTSYPYEWEFEFALGGNSLSELGPDNSEDDGSLPDVSDENVAALQTTIEEQRERIQELETQLNSESGGQQVTINVKVNPAGNQNNFVTGGKALVQVSEENADLSQFQVRYGDGTYSVGEDSQVEIPLVDAGQQEMQFQYGETTESVTINVQEQSDTEVSFPGFGVGSAVLALICIGILSRRRE